MRTPLINNVVIMPLWGAIYRPRKARTAKGSDRPPPEGSKASFDATGAL